MYSLGLLYTYLAECTGMSGRGEAFRSLQRGFIHWSSGRLSLLEVNCRHPQFCHIQCHMTPSKKQGVYKVYLLLGHISDYATILSATCQCAAGLVVMIYFFLCFNRVFLNFKYSRKSASCTHVSALLHCLAALTSTSSTANHKDPSLHQNNNNDDDCNSESVLPITSYICQWKAPKKRKESNLPVSQADFQKHVYGRERKYKKKSLEMFDPRPPEFRGKTNELLKKFFKDVQGEGLGVSLLFDEKLLLLVICY